MVTKKNKKSVKIDFNSKTVKAVGVALVLIALLGGASFIASLISNPEETGITGQAFKDGGQGVQVAYWGMSNNYPLNLGMNTIQTEVKISANTVTSLAAGYLTQDIAAIITGYAGIAADIKVLLGGFVPDPVSAAITLSDKFVNYLRDSSSKCLKTVAINYGGKEAHFVIGTTAEKEYSSFWKGNYIYAKHTYYTMNGNYLCSERKCAGFVYDTGKSTTKC